jgi:hypothetical protein
MFAMRSPLFSFVIYRRPSVTLASARCVYLAGRLSGLSIDRSGSRLGGWRKDIDGSLGFEQMRNCLPVVCSGLGNCVYDKQFLNALKGKKVNPESMVRKELISERKTESQRPTERQKSSKNAPDRARP